MRDQDRALSLAETVLKAAAGADQAQVTVNIEDNSYARFGENYVTQNLESQQTNFTLTYYVGKKSGTVQSADATADGIARTVAEAKEIAQRVPPDNRFVLLPKPQSLPAVAADSLDAARALLAGNPVFEAGGTVEIRELPRTE